MAEGGGNPLAGLYPQPVAPQQNALANDPLRLLGAMNQINQLKQFQAKQAVGGAFQGALNPDGSVDMGRLSSGLQNPAAALAAPEAIGTMLQQRGTQIENAQKQLGLESGQNDIVRSTFAGLAPKPNITDDDLNSAALSIARAVPSLPSATITAWLSGMPADQAGRHARIQTLANIGMGPGAANAPVPGVPTVAGAPTQRPLGAGYGGAPQPIALPPGQPEAIKANQEAYIADQQGAAQTLSNVRPLQQALPIIAKLADTQFGPTSPEFTKAKATLAALNVIDPNTSDASLRQEVGKYLLRYASGAQAAGRSDQALSAAMGSNPNPDTMTKPATLALIKNQIGMDRMDAARTQAFSMQNPGDNAKAKYLDYKSKYYQSLDPRAFSFDLMTPEERRDTIATLGTKNGPAYQKFARSYAIAKGSGIITPEQQQAPQNGQ